MHLDSQIRWLVTALTAATAALALAAPVGAWEDPEGGRQAGNGQGSMPTQLERSSGSTTGGRSHSAESYLQHARSEQQSPTLDQGSGTVVATMNPGLVVSDGKTFVPGVSPNGESTLLEVGPGLRVAGGSGTADVAPVVPTASPSASSSDDGVELGRLLIALAVSLAVAMLMALAAMTARRRRHIVLH